MTDSIASDRALSATAAATLRALVGTIIPASAAHAVPGADDEQIFTDLIRSAGDSLAFLGEAMRELDAAASPDGFVAEGSEQRLALAEQFRAANPAAAGYIVSLVCQCYYRDPRVLASLGMAPRPPFPDGYQTPDGDWSLLDPVRARAPFYRKV